MTRLAAAMVLILAAAAEAAETPRPADVTRASWAYRRDVAVAGDGELAAVEVPLDVARGSQIDLEDVRLVAEDGGEVPYVVERASADVTANVSSWPGELTDHRQQAKHHSTWVVDLRDERTFDRLQLDIPQSDFSKRLHLELSGDGRSWRDLAGDAGVFDREWNGRLRHDYVDLDRAARARWLRITADDRRSRPIEVTGVRVSATRRAATREWRQPFTASVVSSENRSTRYRLDVPAGTPLDAVVLEADDPAFSRQVTAYDVRTVNGRREEIPLGGKRLYRLRLPDEALAVADLRLPLQNPPAGDLVLVVEDGDSPPLRGLRGAAVGAATRLLFPVAAPRLALYYGNPVTRAPLYDIDALRTRLALAGTDRLAAASLGAEAANPAFARPAPLPMVATAGAVVEPGRWRWSRPLSLAGREDIFTLLLGPEDVAVARDDLADVRIVDEKDRQVPFVLARDAGEEKFELAIEPMSGPSDDPRRRRLRLRVAPTAGTTPERLPIVALEIGVADRFFSRPVRVSTPPGAGTREARVVASQVASRTRELDDAAVVPCRIPLDGGWHRELWLEIDEGDNTPLEIESVHAVVSVPRVAFKARPGAYRVLVGNDNARAPQYDLASLRQEVLAYSAVAAEAGPIVANPRFRRRGADYLKQAPPTLVLWGTLVAAVVGLLLLTVRILRSPVT